MIKKLVFGFVVLSSFLLLAADDPFVGTWKMNASKSKFAKGHEFKEVTLVILRQGDIATLSQTGIDGAGKAVSVKWTEPAAGGMLNFTEGGPPAGMTVVMKKLDAKTVEDVSTMNGKQIGTTHVAISANGKMLTVKQTQMDEKGKAFTNISVYNRQ
jgi:hypothetical protein